MYTSLSFFFTKRKWSTLKKWTKINVRFLKVGLFLFAKKCEKPVRSIMQPIPILEKRVVMIRKKWELSHKSLE
jgi:hypothetical protein